jgi:hypothetical protein
MSRAERLREAVSTILGDPEKAVAQFDRNMQDLPPRDAIDETFIPAGPRFFWIDARQSYILSQYVGSVLLAGMSIEIAVRQFLERFFERQVGPDKASCFISPLLEELDFRRIVKLCENWKCFADGQVYSMLHRCYDIRTKYSHAKISAILGSWGSERLNGKQQGEEGEVQETRELKDDEFLRAVVVSMISARDDALSILQLVQQAFEIVFQKSGYYYGKPGAP